MPVSLPKLEWGPAPLRKFVNKTLIPWIASGRVIRSIDHEVDEREDGTLVYNREGSAAALAALDNSPFAPYLHAEDDDTVIRLRWGTLQKDIDPTSNIDLDGLFDDIPTDEIGDADYYCWIQIDLSGLYTTPATDIAAIIDYGEKWNEDVWPKPYEYDTDDGQFDAESEGINLVKVYVPLWYITAHSTIGPQRGVPFLPDKYLVRMCTSHLIMSTTCLNGNASAPYVAPAPSSLFPPGA